MQECDVMVVSSTPVTSLGTTQRVAVGAYRNVRIDCTAQSVWFKVGDGTVQATAGSAGETLLNTSESAQFVTGPAQTNVALIENAASAKASVVILG